MKKVIYLLFLPLVVISGLVFANHQKKDKPSGKIAPKPISAAERQAAMKAWEATPGGITYKKWESSPEGRKVLESAARIKIHTAAFANMEATVTSLSLPPGSRLGFGVMAKIDGVDYILVFDPEQPQLEQLQTLRVNDKLIIKSTVVSHAPKYAYAIVRADYVERNNKVIYKRTPRKGC